MALAAFRPVLRSVTMPIKQSLSFTDTRSRIARRQLRWRCLHSFRPSRISRNPFHCLCALVLLLFSASSHAADAIPGEEHCSGAVDEIVFVGNSKTDASVLRTQIHQQPGSPCSLDAIIDSMQSLMDLGLFRRVSPRLYRQDGILFLEYAIEERYYFFPLPRLSRTSDGELRYGAQLRWDNFLGRFHQVRLTAEKRQEEDGQGPAGYLFKLDYDVPRFSGTRYGLAFSVVGRDQQVELARDGIDYTTGNERVGSLLMSVSRWASTSGLTSGRRLSAGFLVQRREFNELAGDPGPYSDGMEVALRFGINERDVHDDLYRLRGFEWGATVQVAADSLGSDTGYSRADVFLRQYRPIDNAALRNLNLQWRLGISDGRPFGRYNYSLGGGEMLRGMPANEREGDVLTLFNAEMLTAFTNHPTLRWVLFTDIGNVFRKDAINLPHQKFRGGVGLRWKLLKFSNTDLRMDAAWDSQASRPRFYISTSLTF